MIFNTNNYYDGPVAPSPYPVGLEGALMHVYENECNYNALMKAVGISELKYYQETGKSLFVHEAGAFSSFIEKAKTFFKKVIEKIKQIFHKFAAVMNQYTMSDKKFVKTYSKELYRKNLTDFEFNGYTFKGLEDAKSSSLTMDANKYSSNELSASDKHSLDNSGPYNNKPKDSDAIDSEIETNRGNWLKIIGGNAGSYDESEFREELREMLYGGEKEDLDKISIRDQLSYIENAKKDVTDVEKQQKKIVKNVEDFIKLLEKYETLVNKKDSKVSDMYGSGANGANGDRDIGSTRRDDITKNINNKISLMKAESNDMTIMFGMIVQAVKDRNRQAKAICVKAIGYNKKESANYGYYGESSVDDLFAGVTIR